jgi:hypothetical protein
MVDRVAGEVYCDVSGPGCFGGQARRTYVSWKGEGLKGE